MKIVVPAYFLFFFVVDPWYLPAGIIVGQASITYVSQHKPHKHQKQQQRQQRRDDQREQCKGFLRRRPPRRKAIACRCLGVCSSTLHSTAEHQAATTYFTLYVLRCCHAVGACARLGANPFACLTTENPQYCKCQTSIKRGRLYKEQSAV